jgi:hypothetical protein
MDPIDIIATAVLLKSGGIRSYHRRCMHIVVCQLFGVDFNNVVACGWKLKSGEYVWREKKESVVSRVT